MKATAFAVLLLAGVALAAPAALAPLHKADKDVIPNSFIVVLREEAELAGARAFADSVDAQRFLHIGSFKAFTGVFSPSLINAIRARSDLVKYVEADKVVRAIGTQTGATWGIDRVDQTALPLDQTYHYYDSAGEGVDAYVIDTGIRTTHNDFGNRASSGFNFHDNNDNAEDDNGHGTHVAGTIGGTTYGLAKNVNLIAVKVLGRLGSGSLTNVAAGVAWVAEQYAATGRPSVANMSLGSSASASMDAAVAAAIAEGVTFAIASGNSNDDACDYSPARVATAITVNASNNRDARASFSNYGTCSTIFAPGESITSTYYTSDTATSSLSGTSMAAPHVAGAVAILLGEGFGPNPAEIKQIIIENATEGVITTPGTGSPNRLLYSPY